MNLYQVEMMLNQKRAMKIEEMSEKMNDAIKKQTIPGALVIQYGEDKPVSIWSRMTIGAKLFVSGLIVAFIGCSFWIYALTVGSSL